VIIVGSVHNQSTSATNVSYEIGDGTGYVDVRLWLDSADDESGKTSGIEWVFLPLPPLSSSFLPLYPSLSSFFSATHCSASLLI
jgi:hypothetical protein